jgi:D-glycero-D-manno-heptose 1,7-bisphosphate phosphatase
VTRVSDSHLTRRAIFLDRDGVINAKLPEDRYVAHTSEFEFLPGVVHALRTLARLGYVLVVITNQRGIGRGLMTEDQLAAVHDFMREEFRRAGVTLHAVYYCPHDKTEHCPCRKPEPGLILRAERDLGIDLGSSYMVGDSPSDIGAGKRAGTRTVRITAGDDDTADLVFPGLPAFAEFLEDLAHRAQTDRADSHEEESRRVDDCKEELYEE